MKHIGKTNENEVIVALKIEDINELLAMEIGAEIYYNEQAKKGNFPNRAKLMRDDTIKWWKILNEIRKTL